MGHCDVMTRRSRGAWPECMPLVLAGRNEEHQGLAGARDLMQILTAS